MRLRRIILACALLATSLLLNGASGAHAATVGAGIVEGTAVYPSSGLIPVGGAPMYWEFRIDAWAGAIAIANGGVSVYYGTMDPTSSPAAGVESCALGQGEIAGFEFSGTGLGAINGAVQGSYIRAGTRMGVFLSGVANVTLATGGTTSGPINIVMDVEVLLPGTCGLPPSPATFAGDFFSVTP